MRKTMRKFRLPLNLQLFSDELGAEQGTDPGVEVAPAAEVQPEPEVPAETGVESEAAAEPKQSNFEKAFAKRLAEAQAKWEAEYAEKYKDYETYRKATEYLQKQSGINDIMTLKEQIELAELNERADRENVPPEVLKRIDELEAKAARAEALEKQQAEAQQYQEFRADLDKFAAEKGVNGDELYNFMVENNIGNKEVAYKALRAEQLEQQLETAKKDAVREYLASKQAPKAEGAGSAGVVNVDTSKMSWQELQAHTVAKLNAMNNRE